MLVPGIFKQGRVSIMLQILHLDFMHFLLPYGRNTFIDSFVNYTRDQYNNFIYT